MMPTLAICKLQMRCTEQTVISLNAYISAHFGNFFKEGKSWTVSTDFNFAVLWLSIYSGHERGPEGSISCQ